MNRPAIALALIASTSAAPADPTSGVAYLDAPGCRVGLEFERATGEVAPTLRLRPGCHLDLPSTRAALTALVSRRLAEQPAVTDVSVFLGRLIEYPWLAERLARAAARASAWSARRGRLRRAPARINAFAAGLLQADSDLRGVLPGWRLAGVSVEKVLVGPAEQWLPETGLRGRLPFDAMCWLRFVRIPQDDSDGPTATAPADGGAAAIGRE